MYLGPWGDDRGWTRLRVRNLELKKQYENPFSFQARDPIFSDLALLTGIQGKLQGLGLRASVRFTVWDWIEVHWQRGAWDRQRRRLRAMKFHVAWGPKQSQWDYGVYMHISMLCPIYESYYLDSRTTYNNGLKLAKEPARLSFCIVWGSRHKLVLWITAVPQGMHAWSLRSHDRSHVVRHTDHTRMDTTKLPPH